MRRHHYGRAVAVVVGMALSCAAALGSPVELGDMYFHMYRGGSLQVGSLIAVSQDFGDPVYFEDPTGSFSASWTISHAAGEVDGVWDLTITIPMVVTASVDGSAASGFADAFAGVARMMFQLEFDGLPRVYNGLRSLYVYAGEGDIFRDGDIVEPGAYTLLVFGDGDFPKDVYVEAGPGQSNVNTLTRVFDFRLTQVPGPGAGVLLLGVVGLGVLQRRR